MIALLADINGGGAYNIAVFLLLLWASYKIDTELEVVLGSSAHTQPLFASVCFLLFSFLLDFTVLGIYAGDTIDAKSGNKYADTNKFCLA